MRKIYLMLASMALPLLATAAESVPYASDMTTWQIVNVNEDAKTWEVDTSSSDFSSLPDWSKGLKYTWNNSMAADDWAISPAIHLEADTEYKIKIWDKTGSYDEKFIIYLAQSSEISDLTDGVKLIEKNPVQTKSNGEKSVNTFSDEESGKYFIGIHCF